MITTLEWAAERDQNTPNKLLTPAASAARPKLLLLPLLLLLLLLLTRLVTKAVREIMLVCSHQPRRQVLVVELIVFKARRSDAALL